MKDWSDKAEQFQLKPSAALWKNIEKDLDRHKRKRRFILWFFITGSLLIGGGLMHYYQEQGRAFDAKERIVNASPVEIKSNEVQDQKNVIEGNDELPKVNSSADQKQNSSSNKKLSSISTPNSTSINQKQTTVTNIKKKVASKNQNEITEQLQESNNTVEVNHNSIPKQDTTNTATATISPATAADTATVTTAFTIRSYLAKDGAAPVIDTTATATATTATATTDTATAFTIRSYLAKDGTAPVIATTTTTTATSVTIDTTTTATYSMQLGIMPLVSFNRFNEHTDLGSLENYRNNHFKTLVTYATEFRLNMQLNKYLSIGSGFGILTMNRPFMNLIPLSRGPHPFQCYTM